MADALNLTCLSDDKLRHIIRSCEAVLHGAEYTGKYQYQAKHIILRAERELKRRKEGTG